MKVIVTTAAWICLSGLVVAEATADQLPRIPADKAAAVTTGEQGYPIPIEEATRLAQQAAARWRSNSRLLQGFSQQPSEEEDAVPPPGVDGRRRSWAFEFVDPVSHEFITVGVRDGRVTTGDVAGTNMLEGFDIRDLRVAGSRLAQEASSRSLRPGTGGIAGYQYRLGYDPGYKRHVITLVGVDDHGMSWPLTVDPKTGQVLSRI